MRRYGKKQAATRVVHSSIRVPVRGTKRTAVDAVKPPKIHQGSHGRTYAWVPNAKPCCKRKCSAHVANAACPRVARARLPLFDLTLTPDELRAALKVNHTRYLLHTDQRPVCVEMACRIYGVSTTRLYPDKRPRHCRAESRSVKNPKAVCVCSWFSELKDCLDVMPDEGGWYQLPHPKKKMVFEAYVKDCHDSPHTYTLVKSAYFYKLWRTFFPECRTRKHCRFAKCVFCVSKRATIDSATASAAEKADARRVLQLHYRWSNTRERGEWKRKRDDATNDPEHYLCISLDGTDQFPDGLPSFCEQTKDDCNGARLKMHLQIGLSHGGCAEPVFYCGWEYLYGDPNFTIETLYRMIKREEEARDGKLPDTLYLQLDNCIRENKNTYVISFLAWLLERGVFKVIKLSFLPVGHTHFENDQVASRISTAVRWRDIRSVAQLLEILEACYSPRPNCVWVDEVMDWRSLANPTSKRDFPTGSSRVVKVRGIATKIDDPSKEHMGGTSPLHWWLRKDINGKVIVQNKFTCEDELWSAPAHVWNEKAPRPEGRAFTPGTSGLLPADLCVANRRPLSEKREKILRKSLDAIMGRVTPTEGEQLNAVFAEMQRVVTENEQPRQAPAHGGAFACERDPDDDDEADEQHPPLELAQHTMFENQSTQNRARAKRRADGYSKNLLVLQNFIAYEPTYTDETLEKDRSDFWIGKIMGLRKEAREVDIQMWHSTTTKNGNPDLRNGPVYKIWKGNKRARQTTDIIPMSRVYETFELTEGFRVMKRDIRYIMAAKDLRALDEREPGGADEFGGDMGIVRRIEQGQDADGNEEDEDGDNELPTPAGSPRPIYVQ